MNGAKSAIIEMLLVYAIILLIYGALAYAAYKIIKKIIEEIKKGR